MAAARTVTMKIFRGMDQFSGNLRVISGSRRRRGVRPPNRQAIDRSPENQAASDDGSGKTSGLTADSAAGNTGRKPDAEVAKNKAKEAKRTPDTEGGGFDTTLWEQKLELGGGAKLPVDGAQFVEAVNRETDLVKMTGRTLKSKDDRVTRGLLELLLEMRYGKSSQGSERAVKQVVVDIPSAAVERARERERES
jgi:hypothetical protein